MMQAYNIALVPTHRQPFIDIANQFAERYKENQYLLGKQSIPHVTLCHFNWQAQEIDVVRKQLAVLQDFSLTLTFPSSRTKCYPQHPAYRGVWLSLIPDHLAELKRLHLMIASIIKHPTNLAYDAYDPHLTLLNSCIEEGIEELHSERVPLQDTFTLALGLSDKVGQLTEIIT